LGNDASENMQAKMEADSWINVRKVDFGTKGAEKFTLRAKGTGTIDIRTSMSPRATIATIEFSSTEMEDHTIEIPAGKLKGLKNNLFFIVTAATDVYVDAWQFTEEGASGIIELESGKVVKTQRYDLSGRKLSESSNHRGIVIEQYTDENGVKHSRKTY